MPSNWFEFKASAEAPQSDLYLYGEVGGWGASAVEFIDVLSARKDQHINLHIHSPGGSVFEGHAIFNALRSHPAGVTTMVDGIAASMASVIAMAGKPVKIASNGFLMIHNPWSQAAGGSEEMRKQADVLDKLKDSLVKIYADKSGMPESDIAAAMDDETWFSAEEAVAFGLADEIFEGMQAAAKIDLSAISAKAPSGVFQFANPWPAPQWMRDNFRKGLDWFEKGFGGDGLADSTIEEARAIAGGNLVSPDKAQRMAAWFARHMGDLDGVEGDESNPTPGMVAHALWGGWPKSDSERAMAWAEAKYAEHEKTLEDNKMDLERNEKQAQEPVLEQASEPVAALIEEPVLPDFHAMLAKAGVELSEAQAHIGILKVEVEAARVDLEAARAEVNALKAELESEKAKTLESEQRLNAKAAEIVARAGHPPIALGAKSEPSEAPKKDLLKQYNELCEKGSASERIAFVRQHRNELFVAAKSTK
jgi:ATP-dependent Clp endopeptidase proteolytic subunit ClpP